MKKSNGELQSKDKHLEELLDAIELHSDEEEAEIQKAIAEDPDTWEATGPVVHIGHPKRGRPVGRKKQQVTVSLDIDLVEALKKPDKKGWQTRLNAAARAGLGI